MSNNSVRSFDLSEELIEIMADHVVGKKMSVHKEWIYDADGDQKITLIDFIHRIKNIKGEETQDKIDKGIVRYTVKKNPKETSVKIHNKLRGRTVWRKLC